MRIVHVVQTLGMGGQERLILDLSRELGARGHEPAVVSLTPGGDLRAEIETVADVHDVARGHGIDALAPLRMAQALLRLRPDVVHTHNPGPMFYAIPAAHLLRVHRRVHTKHGANIYSKRGLWAARAVVRELTALAAVSEETAAVARTKERVPGSILHVVPNGIPLARFSPDAAARARVRAELGIPERAYVVGTVGRLAVEKDYPLLVRAMAPLLGEQVRLLFVGDGAARGEIERSIPPEAARFVTLTGARRDVPRLLAALDVFSLTSKTEGLPLVIPEAMACALPIVATKVGGLPSIVPGDVGILVAREDRDAAARGLGAAFAALRDDEARRLAMGKAARAHALARFSIETMADAYEALYR
jgi:glycosyltransferase involved in cell wall biosynthesis